jgi:transposase-like protein
VWHVQWGGGGEPCTAESSNGGSRSRAAAEETGVDDGIGEWRREWRRDDQQGLRVLV